MPNIIGKFLPVSSAINPLDAHVGHLKHLTNEKIAKDILKNKHKLNAADARETSKLFSSHIAQALNFHHESKTAISSIRPVLQYYAYLNLSVALILAYRPPNYNRYRRHGVEDKTHSLSKLDLSSNVLKIKQGAVPLFHSILSDVPLQNRTLRLGQIISGFNMCSHELQTRFNKITQRYVVEDELKNISNKWQSIYKFYEYVGDTQKKAPRNKIESAMPLLKSSYVCDSSIDTHLLYTSKASWDNKSPAEIAHKNNGIKLINYGGHATYDTLNGPSVRYLWHGVSRIALLPTLTSTLLLSFSLASIVRYRPLLLDSSMNSPILLVIDTFTSEADSVFIPSLRNLLYKEEVSIGFTDYI